MFIFQGAFLSGLHGVTVEHSGSSCAAVPGFHCISSSKFSSPVGEQDMDVFSEKFRSQDRFQKVNAVFHGLCGLGLVINGKEDTGIYKFKGLDKRTAGFIIINRIHLCNKFPESNEKKHLYCS